MRKITAILVVFTVLFFSASLIFSRVLADERAEAEKSLTPEDLKKLRQDVKELAETLGIVGASSEKNSGNSTKGKNGNNKNWADVADKALELSKYYIASVASLMQKVAPEVWRIMLRQQYAKAITFLAVPWVLVILFVSFFKFIRIWEPLSSDGKEFKRFFRGLLATLASAASIVGVFMGAYAIRVLVNPEYYAIRDMLQLLLGGNR